MSTRETMEKIETMLDLLQQKSCPEGCHACCCAVSISPREAARLGLPPDTGDTMGENDDCRFLKDGRCSVYENRPMTCRVFGCAPKGMFWCRKLKPDQATIDEELADLVLTAIFNEWLGEKMPPPSMEMIHSCRRHDIREGLRDEYDPLDKMIDEMEQMEKEGAL